MTEFEDVEPKADPVVRVEQEINKEETALIKESQNTEESLGGSVSKDESKESEGSVGKVSEIAIPEKSVPWHVKLQVYDGPLDLLLELIKKNEMDIYDIQIAEITRQYLDHLAQLEKLDLEIAGEFLVLAATLIYIKSKMLLPVDEEPEEDESGQDPRSELVRKLLEYQAFKEAAKELGLLEGERSKIFTRQISDYYLSDIEEGELEVETFSSNLFDLLTAFQNVITRSGHEEMHEVFEQSVTIEEKILEVKTILFEKGNVVFSTLFKERWTRNELIATFLALLEIVRSKFARVRQEQQFGDILIEKI